MASAYESYGLKKFMGREFEGVLRTTYLIDEEGRIANEPAARDDMPGLVMHLRRRHQTWTLNTAVFPGLAAYHANHGQQLVGQVLVLVVDDEHAVCAGGHGDVAAAALDHRDGVRQFRRDVFNGFFLGDGRRGQGRQRQAGEKGCRTIHEALQSLYRPAMTGGPLFAGRYSTC